MTTLDASFKPIPGPAMLAGLRGLSQRGFLDYVGDAWRQYGDLFQLKIGPRSLVFALHPEAVRHINVTNRQNYDKLRSYDTTRKYLLGEGLVTSTGDLWKRQRKLMSPLYTPRSVQAYAELMLRNGAQMVERWEKLAHQRKEVEISEEMMRVTASTILKAMFSMETDEAIVGMKDAVETMIRFVTGGQKGFMVPLWVPTATNRKYKAARRMVDDYINGLIAQRRAMPEGQWPDDLLTRLMQARDEETGVMMAEALLRDESVTTFFAGHETVARTMTFAWHALATNPEVAAQLHAELDRVLGDRPPTVADLHRLPYTLQVIKEALRLYPAAPFYVRDAVADDTLAGYAVPAGAALMLSPYYTHRHPAFWTDPLKFNPDRWTPEREAQQHPYAYHPFAAGQRICIGNNFSLLEMHVLLAVLARRFAPRPVPGHVPQWVMQGTLGAANGFPMILAFRQDP